MLHRFITSTIRSQEVRNPLEEYNSELDKLQADEADRVEKLGVTIEEILSDPPRSLAKIETESADAAVRYAIAIAKLAAKGVIAHRESVEIALKKRRQAKAEHMRVFEEKSKAVREAIGADFDRNIVNNSPGVVAAAEALRLADTDVPAVSTMGNVYSEELTRIAGRLRLQARAAIAKRLHIELPADPHSVPVETPPQPENVRWVHRQSGHKVEMKAAEELPVVFESPGE